VENCDNREKPSPGVKDGQQQQGRNTNSLSTNMYIASNIPESYDEDSSVSNQAVEYQQLVITVSNLFYCVRTLVSHILQPDHYVPFKPISGGCGIVTYSTIPQ